MHGTKQPTSTAQISTIPMSSRSSNFYLRFHHFFDAGFYTPLKKTTPTKTTIPNTACPLCHQDFTKFRSSLACKIFDPTPAYPPTTICIIPAIELLTHLQLISKIHPPHKYILNFIYLRHPHTAPKEWNIHTPIPPRGISKSYT